MGERATTRRALLMATGALGTIATLAVPVAVLPKAEAAEQADAELLAMGRELEALWAQEQIASEARGDSAASQELERLAAASGERCRRIVAMQARTPAGLAVKLRALTVCRADEPEDDWIGEVIAGPQDYTTDQRLAFSILRDALAILKVGAPA